MSAIVRDERPGGVLQVCRFSGRGGDFAIAGVNASPKVTLNTATIAKFLVNSRYTGEGFEADQCVCSRPTIFCTDGKLSRDEATRCITYRRVCCVTKLLQLTLVRVCSRGSAVMNGIVFPQTIASLLDGRWDTERAIGPKSRGIVFPQIAAVQLDGSWHTINAHAPESGQNAYPAYRKLRPTIFVARSLIYQSARQQRHAHGVARLDFYVTSSPRGEHEHQWPSTPLSSTYGGPKQVR